MDSNPTAPFRSEFILFASMKKSSLKCSRCKMLTTISGRSIRVNCPALVEYSMLQMIKWTSCDEGNGLSQLIGSESNLKLYKVSINFLPGWNLWIFNLNLKVADNVFRGFSNNHYAYLPKHSSFCFWFEFKVSCGFATCPAARVWFKFSD